MGLLLRFARARHPALDVEEVVEAPDTDHEYPLVLTAERVPGSDASADGLPVAELHPLTAREHGLAAHTRVRLTTRCGTLVCALTINAAIRRDAVCLSYRWGGGQPIHALTNRVLDPVSKMPEFKRCAVRVEPPAE